MGSMRMLFLFVVYSVVICGLISLWALSFHIGRMPFKRVNSLSDIITKNSAELGDATLDIPPVIIESKPNKEFSLYRNPRFITDFSTVTTQPFLPGFIKKLYDLKSEKGRKIQIACFNDNMIEGDLLTQTSRRFLQQAFGVSGVGFVPITAKVSKFRQSAWKLIHRSQKHVHCISH